MGMKEEAYKDKAEAQVREWEAEMDKLKAKLDKADAQARIEISKMIEDLQSKVSAARARLR